MCLAVPLRIKEINNLDAVCERDGIEREIRLDFIKEPKVGDYILAHAGFAIEKVDEAEAKLDLEMARELSDAIREAAAEVRGL